MTVMTAEPGAHVRLEVWGDPIAHSMSPALHTAAYSALGWEWSYDRRRVDADHFASELAGLPAEYRGLSLTFPLKGQAHAAAVSLDHPARLTGAVNTLLLTDEGPRGFNTDVGGLVADLRRQGVAGVDNARIVGAGATATSALVALSELGAARVDVFARRPEAAAPLVALGERLAIRVSMHPMGAVTEASVPVTISTLPGGADVPPHLAERLAAAGGVLYDVVYGHWPTALATAWSSAGNPAVNGLGMLVQQAVRQIRVFRTGDPETPLPHEESIVDVMRRAVMGD